eukprot:gene10323-25504_t
MRLLVLTAAAAQAAVPQQRAGAGKGFLFSPQMLGDAPWSSSHASGSKETRGHHIQRRDLCEDAYETWKDDKIETKCGPNDGDWGKGCKVNAKAYDDDEKWSCDDWCKAQGLACGAAAYEKTKDSCERKDDDEPKCSTRTEAKRKICTCVVPEPPDCTTSCCPYSWDNVEVTCGAPKDCRAVIKTDSTFSYETCTTFCSEQQGGMECVASYDDDDVNDCPADWSNNKGCDYDFKKDETSDAVCECKMPTTGPEDGGAAGLDPGADNAPGDPKGNTSSAEPAAGNNPASSTGGGDDADETSSKSTVGMVLGIVLSLLTLAVCVGVAVVTLRKKEQGRQRAFTHARRAPAATNNPTFTFGDDELPATNTLKVSNPSSPYYDADPVPGEVIGLARIPNPIYQPASNNMYDAGVISNSNSNSNA